MIEFLKNRQTENRTDGRTNTPIFDVLRIPVLEDDWIPEKLPPSGDGQFDLLSSGCRLGRERENLLLGPEGDPRLRLGGFVDIGRSRLTDFLCYRILGNCVSPFGVCVAAAGKTL